VCVCVCVCVCSRRHQCFFSLSLCHHEWKPTRVARSCGRPASVTSCSVISPPQELSSSTPAWRCWVSSSSTAACRRPKRAAWRRSRRCSKTSSAPAAPPTRTRGGRWNTSGSKGQTTIYRTTTRLTWTSGGGGREFG